MKKVALLIALLISIMSFSACGGGGQSVPELVLPDQGATTSGSSVEKEVKQSDCEDNIEGLCDYLEGNYAVSGDPVQMSYDVIGAIGGYKYNFKYRSSNVQVEIYEFDLENLDETGEKALKSIGEKGVFTVLNKEVEGILSDNGKYVMIYTDASGDDENVTQKQKASDLFKEFKPLRQTRESAKAESSSKGEGSSSRPSKSSESSKKE